MKTVTNMADINLTVSIIPLNINDINTTMKFRDCQSELKHIQQHVLYKKSILNKKMYIDLK